MSAIQLRSFWTNLIVIELVVGDGLSIKWSLRIVIGFEVHPIDCDRVWPILIEGLKHYKVLVSVDTLAR
jgi:hypothetical protein